MNYDRSGYTGGADQEHLAEKISRLQERHQQLLLQTAHELDELTHHLDIQVEQARRPLLFELEEVKRALTTSEREREDLRSQLHYIHTSIGGMLQIASPSSPPARVESAHVPIIFEEAAPPAVVEESKPPIAYTPAEVPMEALVAHVPVQSTPEPPVNTKTNVKKERPAKEPRKLIVVAHKSVRRAFLTLLLAGTGFAGATQYQTVANALPSFGQVAGSSTDSSITPSTTETPDQNTKFGEYAESRTILPFEQTQWATFTNPDFGITFAYPSNTSNIVHIPGSNNVWVLRNDSYLFKFSRVLGANGMTLEQYMDSVNYDLTLDGNDITKSSFKAQPAYKSTPTESFENSGTEYYFKHGDEIYVAWLKDVETTSDDGKRLARIVDTFRFTTK